MLVILVYFDLRFGVVIYQLEIVGFPLPPKNSRLRFGLRLLRLTDHGLIIITSIFFSLLRGMFGGSGALTVSAGITLVYVLGATLPNWKWVCIACGSIPIAVFALMPLLPETPNYLIMNGEKQRAYEVIKNTLLILQILILSEVFQMLTLHDDV